MLETIKENQEAINKFMKESGAVSWKIFEENLDVKFPTAADAHFLIVPGDSLDLTKMRLLQNSIKSLFPLLYLEFYTPDDLNNLVNEDKLDPEIRNRILSNCPSHSFVPVDKDHYSSTTGLFGNSNLQNNSLSNCTPAVTHTKSQRTVPKS